MDASDEWPKFSPASATLALSVLGACLTLFAVHAAAARDCRWFGTKPFCDGQCPKGWDYTGQRRSCTTGSQRYCCEPLGSTTTVDKVAPCHKQCAPLLTAVKPVAEARRFMGTAGRSATTRAISPVRMGTSSPGAFPSVERPGYGGRPSAARPNPSRSRDRVAARERVRSMSAESFRARGLSADACPTRGFSRGKLPRRQR